MAEPIDTAAVLAAHPNPSIGPEFYRLVHDLCDEIHRLRAEMDIAQRRLIHANEQYAELERAETAREKKHDILRAAHSGLLRRLRDEMNAWRPGEPGAKECATRVLRALGDEVGD